MTTAHKPQTHATRGGGNLFMTQGGYFTGGYVTGIKHGRDMPAQTALKFRHLGQSTTEEQRDAAELKAQLEERERQHFEAMKREREKRGGAGAAMGMGGRGSSGGAKPLLLADGSVGDRGSSASVVSAATGSSAAAGRSASGGAGAGAGSAIGAASSSAVAKVVDDILAAFDDADDDALERKGAAGDGSGSGSDSSDDDDDDDDDGSDDEEELMRELERIRRERDEERRRKEAEASALAEKEGTEAILKGNPLLAKGLAAAGGMGAGGMGAGAGAMGGSAAVRRRFGDDTVFSNTHANEPEAKKRFVNDLLRSDFHRSFLRKFVM